MDFKIYYHIGTAMTLSSTIIPGRLQLHDDHFEITGGPGLKVAYRDVIGSAETFRLHFACRMARITHRSGMVYVTIPLISLFGKPAVANAIQMDLMQRELDERIRTAWMSQPQPA